MDKAIICFENYCTVELSYKKIIDYVKTIAIAIGNLHLNIVRCVNII